MICVFDNFKWKMMKFPELCNMESFNEKQKLGVEVVYEEHIENEIPWKTCGMDQTLFQKREIRSIFHFTENNIHQTHPKKVAQTKSGEKREMRLASIQLNSLLIERTTGRIHKTNLNELLFIYNFIKACQ